MPYFIEKQTVVYKRGFKSVKKNDDLITQAIGMRLMTCVNSLFPLVSLSMTSNAAAFSPVAAFLVCLEYSTSNLKCCYLATLLTTALDYKYPPIKI